LADESPAENHRKTQRDQRGDPQRKDAGVKKSLDHDADADPETNPDDHLDGSLSAQHGARVEADHSCDGSEETVANDRARRE